MGITKFDIAKRFKQHLRRGFLLTEAIQKYGEDRFSIRLIMKVNTISEAYKLEKTYISKYNSKVPNGYNLTDGGLGMPGVVINEREKYRRSRFLKELPKEKRIGMYGKKHSEETRKKMSLSAKGNKNCLGRKLSEESKDKIRKKHLGKVLGDETKLKISKNHHDISGKNNPMYGKNHSEETIEKLKEKAKSRPKRTWINNGINEKLILVDKSIPYGYITGRLKKT